MLETWGVELARGIGMFFLNPLVYWAFILVILVGYKRIHAERLNFGVKLYGLFAEWKRTWLPAFIASLLISIVTLGIGIVLTYETIIVMSMVTILFSLPLRFSLLSPSYTLGSTYILLLFMPYLLEMQSIIATDLFAQINFTGLAILMGMLLLVEAVLLKRIKSKETFPGLELSKRGGWSGQHILQKMTVIPFFTLVPSGSIGSFLDFWPLVSLGGETYSIVLVPFILGFRHTVRGANPEKVAHKLARSVALLAFIVMFVAVGSIYVAWLSMAAIIIGILGREYINLRHRLKDSNKRGYFNKTPNGLRVLAIIPGTPADRLGIVAGETVKKVNGKAVTEVDEFYEALQDSGPFFKLDIIDEAGETRFVQSAFYEHDHYELGIVFVRERYDVAK